MMAPNVIPSSSSCEICKLSYEGSDSLARSLPNRLFLVHHHETHETRRSFSFPHFRNETQEGKKSRARENDVIARFTTMVSRKIENVFVLLFFWWWLRKSNVKNSGQGRSLWEDYENGKSGLTLSPQRGFRVSCLWVNCPLSYAKYKPNNGQKRSLIKSLSFLSTSVD